VVGHQRPADFVRSFAERPEVTRDDVHLDQLADPPSGPDEWVSAAITAFAEAVRVRDQLRVPATVAMELFLALQARHIGIDFRTLSDLTNQLGWTPPQLVLYRAGVTPDWTGESFREATAVPDLPGQPENRVLLQEWRAEDEDGQIDRRVWLVAPPKASS
jgi:hypothetical protein